MGRHYLTFKKYFPKTTLFYETYEPSYLNDNSTYTIKKENWFLFPFSIQRIWGEFLRIKMYGNKGDIEFEEVRNLVQEIERQIK
ncbi:MAG: hypothetical protein J0H68_06725 [Sphingobacteriia bacterium]|nr:hypothetical protein [Sphingobacteriia bacterium]